MKFSTILAATLAIVPSALAVDQKKSVIVWYEDESTPDSTINSAKQSIIDAGGRITHVYELIRGFAAICGEKTLEQVQTAGSKYDVHIEDDDVVSVN